MGAVNHVSLASEVPSSCRLACFSQSMDLPVQPSGESWFPQLSTFPLQLDITNLAYTLLVSSALSHTRPPINWEKKPHPFSLLSHLVGWDCLAQTVLLLVIQTQADAEDLIPIL